MAARSEPDFDVVVVGAGNAGLSAAVAAMEHGASTLVLERSPKLYRGGNTKQTIHYAFSYRGPDDLRALCDEVDDGFVAKLAQPAYPAEELVEDILRASGPGTDADLMRVLAEHAHPTMQWLHDRGVSWEINWPMARHSADGLAWYPPGILLRPRGGGLAVVDALAARIAQMGDRGMLVYETEMLDLVRSTEGSIEGVAVRSPAGDEVIRAAVVILAAGGFEADPDLRSRYLGEPWRQVKVRGSRFNTGAVLDRLRDHGIGLAGGWDHCHASIIRRQESPYELDNADVFPFAFPYALLLDADGKRFLDEGAGHVYATYSDVAAQVVEVAGGTAFEVYDAKTKQQRTRTGSRAYDEPAGVSETLEEASHQAGLPVEQVLDTVGRFNAAVQDGEFDPERLDGKRTVGLEHDKTNWAVPLDTPPFEIYALEVGITFTYGGVAVDASARALDQHGQPLPGLFVVGEMAGTFQQDYLAGSGMTKGSVFGLIAGREAAAEARRVSV